MCYDPLRFILSFSDLFTPSNIVNAESRPCAASTLSAELPVCYDSLRFLLNLSDLFTPLSSIER